MEILEQIKQVSGNLSWSDIEHFCSTRNYIITHAKNKYKVKIGNTVWVVHLVHGTKKLKHGIVDRLKRVLQKENEL
jgi:hypothetical protein